MRAAECCSHAFLHREEQFPQEQLPAAAVLGQASLSPWSYPSHHRTLQQCPRPLLNSTSTHSTSAQSNDSNQAVTSSIFGSLHFHMFCKRPNSLLPQREPGTYIVALHAEFKKEK